MNLFMHDIKTKRVIDCIREQFPGKWRYNRQARMWECSDGSYVQAVSCLAPRYDGDDDTFVTQYWRYFPDSRWPERMYRF